jgi:pescadillo protein
MHYVIASKALRKCFISIKGYYFQAEIKGQKVTWVMPHKLAYHTPDDVDFRIMSTFVEFYSILLGFINFKSYQDLGLIYPPKLSISQKPSTSPEDKLNALDFNDEYLASLNCDFLKNGDDEDSLKDEFHFDEENSEQLEKAKLEERNLNRLKDLFKGLKFFLNREVPREQFVFAIKSFSGEVSWDKAAALGATYQEDDQSITHQVIDRPLAGKTHFNRVYIQPQWVFDCINENMLLPVDDYLPGAILPPHLSPFRETTDGSYVPPEKQRLLRMKLGLPEILEEEKKESEVNHKEMVGKKNNNNDKKINLEETTILKKAPGKKNKNNDKTSAFTDGAENDSNDDEKDSEDVDTENEEDINDMKVDLDSPDEEDGGEENDEKELVAKEKQEVNEKNNVSHYIILY